jgi:hypothetical protein
MAEKAELLTTIFSSEEDRCRCLGSLAKLARHLSGNLVLTGGLAIGWLARQHHRAPEPRPFNDLDLVVETLANLPQTLTDDFLVAHFHPTRGPGKILLQLVDAEHTVRVDLFTPVSASLRNRTQVAEIAGIACRVVAAEDLAARLLSILYDVLADKYVEPKYYKHFILLSEFIDLNKAREIWSDYRKADQPQSFDKAIEAVHHKLASHPALLRKDSYDQNFETTCPWCIHNQRFPVSSRKQIFEVLGYV